MADMPTTTVCRCGQCDGHHGHPDGPSSLFVEADATMDRAELLALLDEHARAAQEWNHRHRADAAKRIVARFDALCAALADARHDEARLDWLEDQVVDAMGKPVYVINPNESGFFTLENFGGGDVRATISAAMASPEAPST